MEEGWPEPAEWWQQMDNEARRYEEEQLLLASDDFFQQWLDSLKECEDGTLCE